jgi:hypothetical protein
VAGIINRSYFDAAQKGRDAAQQEQANALRAQAAQQDIAQTGYVNNLMRDPTTTAEQFARAGRSDIGNALTNEQNSAANAQAEKVKQFAEQVVTATKYTDQVPVEQTKAFVEKNFPFLVETYGPEWQTATPEQVRAELHGIGARFGAQIGVGPAPAPVKWESSQGPRGSIIQTNPQTGEMKQVVGPDNSQPAPVNPNASNSREFKNIQGLRKEFDGQQAVKDYKLVVPLYRRAISAPNTRAGDVSIIYALGKMFDPGSVVREGELTLSQNTAPWLQKLASTANSQITGKGALSPETRKAITDALKGQLDSLKQSYSLERDRFASYANDNGFAPGQVVGPDPGADFDQPQKGGVQSPATGGWSIKPLGTN